MAGLPEASLGLLVLGSPTGPGRHGRWCAGAPALRIAFRTGAGAPGGCNGALALDLNAWMAANPVLAPAAGETVVLQAWTPGGTSGALRVSIRP